MLYEFELLAAMTDGDDEDEDDDDEMEKDEEEKDELDGGPEIGTVVEEEEEPEF